MEAAIQKLAVISLLVIGLSHVIQPKAWAGFFVFLHGKGKTGSLINASIHFPLGALIVAFHNVWSGVPIVLTLLGYAWLIKSLIYFVAPTVALKSMARVSVDKPAGFVYAGIAMVLFGGILSVSLITGT